MDQQRYRRKVRLLWVMILVAVVYCGVMYVLRSLTGTKLVDGTIGVLLGLYICSHPAANAVDLLFMGRGTLSRTASQWSGVRWLALNMTALLAGWVVIVIGAAHFVG